MYTPGARGQNTVPTFVDVTTPLVLEHRLQPALRSWALRSRRLSVKPYAEMGKRRIEEALAPSSEPLSNPFAALSVLAGQVPSVESTPSVPQREPVREAAHSSPFCNTIVVQREKQGRGGKTVTVIRGIDADQNALEATALELRQTFGCGGHVSDGRVVLAGNQGPRVAAWLKQRGARRVIIGN